MQSGKPAANRAGWIGSMLYQQSLAKNDQFVMDQMVDKLAARIWTPVRIQSCRN